MKGLVYDIKRFAVHDGPGIRTTVFFQGCPLDCWWCQNPESIGTQPNRPSFPDSKRRSSMYGPSHYGSTVDDLMKEIEKDKIFYDRSGGGVTLSGGEPLQQSGFAGELLSACKEMGIHTAVDTCGHVPWAAFDEVIPFTDLFLYDLKLASEEDHLRYTGADHTCILENLTKLEEAGGDIIVRVPLIPGVTDTMDNLQRIRDTVSTLTKIRKIHLLPYNPLAEDKYGRWGKKFRLAPGSIQTAEDLERMKEVFSGYAVEIGG